MSMKASDSLPPKRILALDFDGVVCASSGESSVSAIMAAKKFWPSLEIDDSIYDNLRNAIMELRPIIETGYENMLVCRLLVERSQELAKEEREREREMDTSSILSSWNANMRDDLTKQYQTTKEELVKVFGQTRDEFISSDFSAWVGLNEVYSCVREAVEGRGEEMGDFYIITTKQERFVRAILSGSSLSSLAPPSSRLFDLDSGLGPKPNVLKHILRTHQRERKREGERERELKIVFVEDRVETLLQVINDPDIPETKRELYLADWGYNTAAQREMARHHPQITLIDGTQFKDLIIS
eukprot:CAMPEP_0182429264 /NCGR_PEP_ID=MMETSP1167-20130531/25639_1 /TAXON_ID=2988 /ORGANISM="Mallomonas Sp, Strain CCMP3275" /LENGTH=297 /DNA_ID=CAMNT_0024612679 /DNA_START=139 /DNA_END=1029 /DNA_ORIENTATION=-